MFELRPSGASRWTECAAYPRFISALPEQPPSDPAREGTCAAWLAEIILKGEVPDAASAIGRCHENGWEVDAEMASYIQDYVEHLQSRDGEIHVERKVRLNKMIAGTPDAFAIVQPVGNDWFDLIVDDLKYGFGTVEPYRNKQVAIYAGAVMRMPKIKHLKIRKVIIGIYQPRSFHVNGIYRTWDIWPEQLMAFVREIEAAGEDCQDLTAPATPGFHCEHCEAAHTCVAIANTIYEGFRTISDERQGTLDAKQLANEMTFINMMSTLVKARKSALDAEATARMARSEHIPGYGYEEQQGNNKFKVSPLAVMLKTGVTDVYEKKKLATPAEIVRRGADKNVVKELTYRPRLPPKLIKLPDDYFERQFGKRPTET